jgi:CBS domain-containing protein
VKAATARVTVADAMHRGVVTCSAVTPLSKVAQMMVGHRIHCVVVNSRDEGSPVLWGVVSDLDLVSAIAHEQDEETPAGKVAATPAVTVGMSEPLQRAAQLMSEHAVTHLVVVRGEQPVGVISTLDLARMLAD